MFFRAFPIAVLALASCLSGGGELLARPELEDAGAGLPEAPILVEADAGDACRWQGRPDDPPLPLVVTLGAAELEGIRTGAGAADGPADPWPALEGAFACSGGRHLEIAIRLKAPAGWDAAPDPQAAVAGWISAVEALALRVRGKVRLWILAAPAGPGRLPAARAYLVEMLGTLLRSIDPGAAFVAGIPAEEAFGGLAASAPGRLRPYVEGLALEADGRWEDLLPLVREAHPGLPIFVGLPPADPATMLERIERARAAGARGVLVDVGADPAAQTVLANRILAVPSRFVPDAASGARLEAAGAAAGAASGSPEEGRGAILAALMDTLGPERAVLLAGPGIGARPLRLRTGAEPILQARAADLASGGGETAPAIGSDDAGGFLDVGGGIGPILVRWVPSSGPRAAPESIGVTAGYEPTVEEVLANHRTFDAAQTRRTRHYLADATISYRYRAEALNESIEVASRNRLYWKDGVGDYEELELWVNGARWRGPAPALPFVQAEKVREVPVEIRLDDTYRYRLEGRDRIEGKDCWVVEFEPLDPTRPSYSGRIWIDGESWARRRIRMVQHGLEEPITGNEDILEYGWVAAGDGEHWLPLSGYRQMIFTVLGRAIAVERRVRYEAFVVNGEDFDARREAALASGRPILRDDRTGTGYLVEGEGGALLRSPESLRNVAIFGGLNVATDEIDATPVAGLNYFDFDFRGTGTQLDVAFAGVLLAVAWTDPSLGGSRWQLTGETRLIALPDRVKRTTDAGRVEEEDVKVLEERAEVVLGRPFSSFWKIEGGIGIGWDDYRRSDRTGSAMVLPATGWTGVATLRMKYQRSGTSLDAWVSEGRRSEWEDWGYPGGSGGLEDDVAFGRWGASAGRTFPLGPLARLSAGIAWMDGRDLDRFSRFRIGEFRNARVRGYNGYDIGFDRGATAQVYVQAPLPFGGLALDVGLDAAIVENEEDFGFDEGGGSGRGIREWLAGAGLGVSFNGPWGTIMSVRTGLPLGASLDVGSGGVSLRWVIVRTWADWPRRSRPKPAP